MVVCWLFSFRSVQDPIIEPFSSFKLYFYLALEFDHIAIRSLHSVSLSECPVSRLDCAGAEVAQLQQLNLSNTAVADWAEVDRLRGLPGLTHLRMMDCPFNRSGESDCTIKRNLFAKTTFAKKHGAKINWTTRILRIAL